jgi:hypothetical protein
MTPEQIIERLDEALANLEDDVDGDSIALLRELLPDLVMQVMARQELERLGRVIEQAERGADG